MKYASLVFDHFLLMTQKSLHNFSAHLKVHSENRSISQLYSVSFRKNLSDMGTMVDLLSTVVWPGTFTQTH